MKAGLTPVVLSVEPAEKNRAYVAEHGLKFPLYHDPEGAVARAWGVFEEEHGYALAATFVIKAGGEIAYRYIGTGKTDRPDVDALLAVLAR